MRRRAQGDLPPGHALLCLLLLALGALSLPSCSSSPAQDHPPEVEASQAQSSPEPKPDSTARLKTGSSGGFEDLDKDKDGRVTRKEFNVGRSTGASDVAFSCLDADMNGYVTKEEQSKLKKHFYRSHLSQLSEDGLRDWLTYRKCLPTDVEKYLPRFKEAEVNGLSLWEYAVKRPGLLKDELGIDNVNVRRTLVQAVCREIEGLGCLGPPSSQALTTNSAMPDTTAFVRAPADTETFFGRGQDSNDDGQVSEEEFGRQQSIRGAGIKEAYLCLDSDQNGQITRQEMWDLKNLFWKSKLSKLTHSEFLSWLLNPKCVDTDMREYIKYFRENEFSGWSLWSHCIQNPQMMKTHLGIHSDMKRARLAESVCREIVGQGCLLGGMWEGWWGGWGFWLWVGGVLFSSVHYLNNSLSQVIGTVFTIYLFLQTRASHASFSDRLTAYTRDAVSAAREAVTGVSRFRRSGQRSGSGHTRSGQRMDTGNDAKKRQSSGLVSEADRHKRRTHPPTGLRRSASERGLGQHGLIGFGGGEEGVLVRNQERAAERTSKGIFEGSRPATPATSASDIQAGMSGGASLGRRSPASAQDGWVDQGPGAPSLLSPGVRGAMLAAHNSLAPNTSPSASLRDAGAGMDGVAAPEAYRRQLSGGENGSLSFDAGFGTGVTWHGGGVGGGGGGGGGGGDSGGWMRRASSVKETARGMAAFGGGDRGDQIRRSNIGGHMLSSETRNGARSRHNTSATALFQRFRGHAGRGGEGDEHGADVLLEYKASKYCNYASCNKQFSKWTVLRKMQRYQCDRCKCYFCEVHKSKSHHGCVDMHASYDANQLREWSHVSSSPRNSVLWTTGVSDDEDMHD